MADKVDDNSAKGDIGESSQFVVGTGFGVVTHILLAPDGVIYVASISAGAVYRVGPSDKVGGGAPIPSPSPSASLASPDAVDVTVATDTASELAFEPSSISVPAGSEVRLTFVNRSTVPHNLTFGEPINVATSTVVAAAASETIAFPARDPGTFQFVCTLHPGMSGTLIVEDR